MDVEAPGQTAAVGMAGEHSHSTVSASRRPDDQVPHPHRAAQLEEEEPLADAPRGKSATRGRPPANTERTKRTVKDNWNRARTDEARAKALVLALRSGLLQVLPLEALAWGRARGVLTQRQYQQAVGMGEEQSAAPAAPVDAPPTQATQQQAPPQSAQEPASQQRPAAAAPAQPPASASAGAPAGGTQAAPAGSTAQPQATPAAEVLGPTYMGQDGETVAMYAEFAYPVLKAIADRFKWEGFDPTTPKKGVLFKGNKALERDVDCVPVSRMAELVGVIAAERWPTAGGGSSGQAKKELAVLALAAFGPAVATAGKRAVGTLWDLGRGIGAKLRSRRAGRGGGDT